MEGVSSRTEVVEGVCEMKVLVAAAYATMGVVGVVGVVYARKASAVEAACEMTVEEEVVYETKASVVEEVYVTTVEEGVVYAKTAWGVVEEVYEMRALAGVEVHETKALAAGAEGVHEKTASVQVVSVSQKAGVDKGQGV